MGFNTAMIVRNDFVHEIAKDIDFGTKVKTAISIAGHLDIRHQEFAVLPSQHADTAQIVVVGGNMIRSLGFGDCKDSDEALLKKLAARMGYKLVRKANSKIRAALHDIGGETRPAKSAEGGEA